METAFISWLRERLPGHPALRLGAGDDAAVLALGGSGVVVTTDLLTDGVDFELSKIDARRAGRKALAANLSDLAAMAAEPAAAFVSLALPREGALELAKRLYEGILPLAAEFGVCIAGGDTNTWDGRLVISVTAIGRERPHGVWRRSAARPGDAILVTGTLGGSILGKHLDFVPRVREALALAERYPIRAAMDISDGLTLDLSRMAAESSCGAVLDLSAVPIAPAAERQARETADGRTPLDHALADGEDFELLLAAKPAVAESIVADRPLNIAVTRIGEFIETSGLWQRDAEGRLSQLPPRGYEHH